MKGRRAGKARAMERPRIRLGIRLVNTSNPRNFTDYFEIKELELFSDYLNYG